MKVKRRTLIYLLVGVVLVVLLVFAFLPEPVPVETATVSRGPMNVTVDEKGETRVRDRFVITAPVTGEVGRIDLREGSRVQKGDVVAKITPPELDPRQKEEVTGGVDAAEASLREARSMVSRAEAAFELARKDRQRIARLAAEGIASAETLDQAKTAEQTARDDLAAARHRAETASAQLEVARAGLLSLRSSTSVARSIEVHSPVEGQVLRVPERSRRVVTAGEPLLIVSNASDIELVIEVLSADAVKISPGDPVIVDDWGGDQPLHGKVRVVEPSGFTRISALGIEEQRVNVIADLDQTPSSLGDGYRIEARIVVWENGDVLRVPVSALFRNGQDWNVFVVEGGHARVRTVRIGHRNSEVAEVTDGLKKGDVVITHPGNDVSDGAKVKVAN